MNNLFRPHLKAKMGIHSDIEATKGVLKPSNSGVLSLELTKRVGNSSDHPAKRRTQRRRLY
jgi:hypothetical protein